MQESGLMLTLVGTPVVNRLTPCKGVRSSCEMLSNASTPDAEVKNPKHT